MTTDPLSLLRAGLDEDERIARAAAERAAEWRTDGRGVDGGPFEPADPEWGIPETGEHTIVYDEGWPLASEAHHIARQDPKATLDRVEAIRKVIARRDQLMESVAEDVAKAGEDSLEYAVGVACVAALNAALADLASIYAPEPTETGGTR